MSFRVHRVAFLFVCWFDFSNMQIEVFTSACTIKWKIQNQERKGGGKHCLFVIVNADILGWVSDPEAGWQR